MIEMFGPMDKSTKSVELNGGFNLNNSFSATRILSPTGYNIEEKGQLLKDIQESPEIIQPYCLVSITQESLRGSFPNLQKVLKGLNTDFVTGHSPHMHQLLLALLARLVLLENSPLVV